MQTSTQQPGSDALPIRMLSGRLDLWAPAPAGRPVELDLGCGKGGFLLDLAAKYPERTIVGADVMLGRLRKLRNKAKARRIANVELLRVNAWELLGHMLPDECLYRVHILCPDPWPKKRHRANRLVTSELVGRIARKLQSGGTLHLATDDPSYAAFMLTAVRGLDCFCPARGAIRDIRELKSDFEKVFEAADRSVCHIAFQATRSWA